MGGGPGGAACTGRRTAVCGGTGTNSGGGGVVGVPVVEPRPEGNGAGTGVCPYRKTFLRPISSLGPSGFSIKSRRIRASVGAGGLADVFVSGSCTAAVVAGRFMR